MYENRTLVRGDNLDEMRKLPDACIDLIATDPPFSSKRDYFVPHRDEHGQEPNRLVRTFTDTWTWGEASEESYNHLLVEIGGQVGDTYIQGMRQIPKGLQVGLFRYSSECLHTGYKCKGLVVACGKDFFDVSNEKNCKLYY